MPAADPDLAAVIHTLMARDPVERPWDAAAVAERLGDIAARLRATRTAGDANGSCSARNDAPRSFEMVRVDDVVAVDELGIQARSGIAQPDLVRGAPERRI